MLGICALSWAPPHFGLLLYCRRFVQYGVQNCENTLQKNTAIMEVFYCFTVAIGLTRDASNYCTRTTGRQLQRAFKTRWLSSEAAVRIRSEILAIWAVLKLSEDKNDAMCVVLLRLMKTKNLNMLLSFCQHWHLT